jgi:hypothetical protein
MLRPPRVDARTTAKPPGTGHRHRSRDVPHRRAGRIARARLRPEHDPANPDNEGQDGGSPPSPPDLLRWPRGTHRYHAATALDDTVARHVWPSSAPGDPAQPAVEGAARQDFLPAGTRGATVRPRGCFCVRAPAHGSDARKHPGSITRPGKPVIRRRRGFWKRQKKCPMSGRFW